MRGACDVWEATLAARKRLYCRVKMTLNSWKIASELVQNIVSSVPVIMGGAWAWWSYDVIAETYDRLAVPHVFTQPAKDLVAMLKLPSGARALDVGAGTGVAALLALQSAGPGAPVVALDSSLGMLRLARKKGLPSLVAGTVPGLPFPDAVFDGLVANFVLSHIPSYQAALLDMARVLRPGGRLGFSAWGPGQSDEAESVLLERIRDDRSKKAVVHSDGRAGGR